MSNHIPYRVLFIDDDEDDFVIFKDLISRIPQSNYKVDWCKKFDAIVDLICKTQYDICFIDYFLGSRNGLDLMKSCLSCKPDLPFIFLTGKGNQDISIEALHAGASDYLVKSELNTEKLERCIRYCIEKAEVLRKYRLSELRFRNIYEQSVDAIFIADEKLNFKNFNPSLLELTGYSKQILEKSNLFDFIDNESESVLLKKILPEATLLKELEMTIKDFSGRLINVLFSYRKIYESDSQFYIQGVLHDITHIKKMEQSLLISEKMAAAGRLSLALAHEIRNPLTNIQLSLHYLKENIADKEQYDMVDIIERNSIKIEKTLKQLLHSSGRPHANFSNWNLVEIINDSLKEAFDHLTLKNINLTRRFDALQALISADYDLLKMAIFNVMINAIEAMDKASPHIIVDLNEQGNFFLLSIQDNGCGMSSDKSKKIFEPFFSDKPSGLGLGLSTALNIFNVHKAEIDIDSKEKIGTIFNIRIPRFHAD